MVSLNLNTAIPQKLELKPRLSLEDTKSRKPLADAKPEQTTKGEKAVEPKANGVKQQSTLRESKLQQVAEPVATVDIQQLGVDSAVKAISERPLNADETVAMVTTIKELNKDDGQPINRQRLRIIEEAVRTCPSDYYAKAPRDEQMLFGRAWYEVTGDASALNPFLPVRTQLEKLQNEGKPGFTKAADIYDAQVQYVIDHANWIDTTDNINNRFNWVSFSNSTGKPVRESTKYLLAAGTLVEGFGLKQPDMIEKVLERNPHPLIQFTNMVSEGWDHLRNYWDHALGNKPFDADVKTLDEKLTFTVNREPAPVENDGSYVAGSYNIGQHTLRYDWRATQYSFINPNDGFHVAFHEGIHAADTNQYGFQLNGMFEEMSSKGQDILAKAIHSLNRLPVSPNDGHLNYGKKESHTDFWLPIWNDWRATEEGLPVLGEYFYENRLEGDVENKLNSPNLNETLAEFFGFDPSRGFQIVI